MQSSATPASPSVSPISPGRRGRTLRTGLVAVGLSALLGGTLISPAAASTAYPASCVSDRYGRMFPGLAKASWSNDAINRLSEEVMAEAEDNPTPENQLDNEDNTSIDAGYTYVGQLLDHDIAREGMDNDLTTPIEPTQVPNSRTAALDLDQVYGSGPTANPELYEADGYHLRTGAGLTGSPDTGARDLPRAANGQALLGDARDDENRIVGGLHSIMIRFHNKRADNMKFWHPLWSNAKVLAETQKEVRKYYQYAVLTDYLPTVAGQQTVTAVLPSIRLAPLTGVSLKYYNPCTEGMPVEFSVGAYRFGHSQVRALYRINSGQPSRVPVFTTDYTNAAANLSGFSPAPTNYGIDWSYFFPTNGRQINRPQYSYKIDNSLTFSLSQLPLPETGLGPSTLATRNLLRSEQLSVPSGQDVARAMGLTPLRDDQILVGKATGDVADAAAITTVDPSFAGKAPLWTYVLAEATANAYPVSGGRITGAQKAPFRLGPVGARLVTETVVGLTWADQTSVLHDPLFVLDPTVAPLGKFGFTELIKYTTR